MVDACIRATCQRHRLEIAVVRSSRLNGCAQQRLGLEPTSAIALGRLLTATALLALTRNQPGVTGLQVLSKGRIRQIFADSTHDGRVRGFVKHPDLSFPLTDGESASGRRRIAPAVLPGQLSVVRKRDSGEYAQSAVELVSGEVDRDVEHFLWQSDQVPTVMGCEALLNADGQIEMAGGVLVQALPDGDLDAVEESRNRICRGALADFMRERSDDPQALLTHVAPDARVVDVPQLLRWECRCSASRAVRSLRLMSPADLAEMIDAEEPAEVKCDFCSTLYRIEVRVLREIFIGLVKAEA